MRRQLHFLLLHVLTSTGQNMPRLRRQTVSMSFSTRCLSRRWTQSATSAPALPTPKRTVVHATPLRAVCHHALHKCMVGDGSAVAQRVATQTRLEASHSRLAVYGFLQARYATALHLSTVSVSVTHGPGLPDTVARVDLSTGQWHDAWNGSVITGPRTVEVAQPYHRQPMWHKAGSMLVLCDDPGLRVTEQDWSTLTLDVFPSPVTTGEKPVEISSSVFERSDAAAASGVARTTLRLLSGGGDGNTSTVRVEIGTGCVPRAWTVRINLRRNQTVVKDSAVLTTLPSSGDDEEGRAVVSTEVLPSTAVRLVDPFTSTRASGSDRFFPFGGSGSPSAAGAGPVVEVSLDASQKHRVLELEVTVPRSLVI